MNLQTFTILMNVIFVICEVPSPYRVSYNFGQDTHPLSLDSVSIEEYYPDSNEQTTATENIENNEKTTEHTIETTSKDDVRDCPRGQSSFSKEDLVMIINYFADVQFNILSKISHAYNNTAIQARDKLLQEFNEFKTQFMDRPNHLVHVLDDMENTRQTKIVPLVNTAADTLQEFAEVEDDFDRLYIKTIQMLDDLEKSKQICELNNCYRKLLRSSFSANGVMYTKPKIDENNMCSTIDNVHDTISERFLSYEQEEIDRVKTYITDNDEILENAISLLKERLRETAVSEFGITMYEILNLQDDHFHFMNSLTDFNVKSHTNNLKQKNINIEFNLIDLDNNNQRYRRNCLSCGQVQRRRRYAAVNKDVENIENVSDKKETNILDQLISDKLYEIRKVVHANITDIFKQLNDTVNDSELAEKTVAQLKPIQESVSQRTISEKQALEALMKYVPKEAREHVDDVQLKATALINSIIEANAFFP